MLLKHCLGKKTQYIVGSRRFCQKSREVMLAFNGLFDLSGKFRIAQKYCSNQVTVVEDKSKILLIRLFFNSVIAAIHGLNPAYTK